MSLPTGTPVGNILTQNEIIVEGAPVIYFQDATANPLKNPDADGFYWGLSGTSTYPVYQLGCYIDVALSEDVTVNALRCDTIGDKGAIQKRNYLELTVTLKHLFPLTFLSKVGNFGDTVVAGTGTEKVGIGGINNNQRWMVYLPQVYDTDTGDYVAFHFHRAQFVDAWTINMPSGDAWNMTGVKIRAYADEAKPSDQRFAVVVRADASALP